MWVRENSDLQFAVEQYLRLSAAERRKNAAHGASRGCKWKTIKPRRAKDEFFTHTLMARRDEGPQQNCAWRDLRRPEIEIE